MSAPVVACLMMQRDEAEMLPRWLAYHGAMFGHKNLYVFDNGSSLPAVLAALEQAEGRGSHVVRGYDGKEDFENKGHLVGEAISDLDHRGGYDFLIPLDCDEFVGVCLPDGRFSCRPWDVLTELERFRNARHPLAVERRLFNAPQAGLFCEHPGWTPAAKLFFPSRTYREMDVGFHAPPSAETGPPPATGVVHFHFHFKPIDVQRARARRILEGRVDLDNTEALRAYQGKGYHLVKYLMMSETDYAALFDAMETVRVDDLVHAFDGLGFDWPYAGSEKDGTTSGCAVSIPDSPHMPAEETAHLVRCLEQSRCFLEYGCGGSTMLALRSRPDAVISVDTDARWVEAMSVRAAFARAEVHVLHCDVGPVGSWGIPADSSRSEKYPLYPVLPWARARALGWEPDLVLIDGRFRVASFLYTLFAAAPGTTILFDDYVGRSSYLDVERHVRPDELVGRMGVFTHPGSVRVAELAVDLVRWSGVPD